MTRSKRLNLTRKKSLPRGTKLIRYHRLTFDSIADGALRSTLWSAKNENDRPHMLRKVRKIHAEQSARKNRIAILELRSESLKVC
jgi:PhoPQ-activated pathogenicity-related protein